MRTMTIALALAGAMLTGCGGWGSEAEPREEELVLRGYPAPGRAEDLASAIGVMLRLGERHIGSARVGPGDQVLVLAPRSVHEGIEDLVREQREASRPVTPDSVSMTYWFVGARPKADAAAPTGSLKEVEEALTEIAHAQGPHDFRLIERLQMRQMPGSGDYWADSPNLKVRQSISLSDGDVVAWIRAVPAGRSEIKTRVKLRPGQLLVLGQVGLDTAIDPFPREPGARPSAGPPGPPAGFDKALYVIIRADVDPPA